MSDIKFARRIERAFIWWALSSLVLMPFGVWKIINLIAGAISWAL